MTARDLGTCQRATGLLGSEAVFMDAARTKERYEVQFQADGVRHSSIDRRDKAELYVRSLANWNVAAQVLDTYTKEIVFRAGRITNIPPVKLKPTYES